MDADSGKALPAFGFLTVLEHTEHGLFGGYLVLSPQGRPLEFRGSTPVMASRAQEILYGPTLKAYLFADVIGQSLVAGAELGVEVILTDQLEMLALAQVRREEVLYVEALPSERSPGCAAPESARTSGISFEMGGCRITAAPMSLRGEETLKRWIQPLVEHIYLAEPFERIRAAMAEAQLASQDAVEDGDDRAAA
jgi:hypothetical protein